MTITLTNAEALKILTNYWQNQLKLDIPPVVNIGATRDDLAQQLSRAVGLIRTDNKIQCIRNLRTAVQNIPELNYPGSLGLSDSKWAVENWSQFVSFVASQGRLPKDGYNNGLK
jgi:hypothetical protein